jgi:hypothetical protein
MNTPDPNTPQRPTFILSFIQHYSSLLVLFVVLVVIGRIDAITYFVGPVFFLIELLVGCMVGAAFIKHVFWRSTVDTYTQNLDEGTSEFVTHWTKMSVSNPDLKVALTIFLMAVLYFGACIIAASIAK